MHLFVLCESSLINKARSWQPNAVTCNCFYIWTEDLVWIESNCLGMPGTNEIKLNWGMLTKPCNCEAFCNSWCSSLYFGVNYIK